MTSLDKQPPHKKRFSRGEKRKKDLCACEVVRCALKKRMQRAPALVWFRRDLRISDNTALHQACARKLPIVPVFIFDPLLLSEKKGASRRTAFLFLHDSVPDCVKQMGFP